MKYGFSFNRMAGERKKNTNKMQKRYDPTTITTDKNTDANFSLDWDLFETSNRNSTHSHTLLWMCGCTTTTTTTTWTITTQHNNLAKWKTRKSLMLLRMSGIVGCFFSRPGNHDHDQPRNIQSNWIDWVKIYARTHGAVHTDVLVSNSSSSSLKRIQTDIYFFVFVYSFLFPKI